MPFPISINGKLVVDSMEVGAAISAVEAMLRRAKASSVTRTENRIDFTAGFFRLVTNSNLLGSVDSGCVVFRQLEHSVEIAYRLSFIQMLVYVSVTIPIFFGLLPVIMFSWQSRVPLPVLAVAWLCLFGANYLITFFRFSAALRAKLRARAAEDLGRRSSS